MSATIVCVVELSFHRYVLPGFCASNVVVPPHWIISAPRFTEGGELTRTAKVEDVPEAQELPGVTVTFPEVDARVMKIEFVPWPELMTDPEGTVHV